MYCMMVISSLMCVVLIVICECVFIGVHCDYLNCVFGGVRYMKLFCVVVVTV